MSIASALLLAGAAAYLVGALVAAAAVDYRELAASADVADPGSTGGRFGGSGGPLLADERATMEEGQGDEEALGQAVRLRAHSSSSRGGDEAEAAALPDRSLLPSDAHRSS